MKVLLVNTPSAPRFRGGDLTQMRKTGAALRELGIQTVESFEEKPRAQGCDIAHVFNLRTIGITGPQIAHLRRQGVPVVLSPIYLDPSYALWGTRAIRTIFGKNPAPEELAKMIAALRERRLRVNEKDAVFAPDTKNRTGPDYDESQKRILAMCEHLLPNSYLEHAALLQTLRATGIPFTMVPYGVDPGMFLDPDPEPFIAKTGLRDFVITAGRVEVSKNQLMLAIAMRDLDVPLVMVGGNLQPYYLEWVKKYGTKNLHYFSHIPHEELRSAYAAARVHALPSWIETCGLVHMEAALANCSLVLSTAGYELEYYRDLGYYCDPASPESIRFAVQEALKNRDVDASRRLTLKELILREYTWPRAAELTLKAYQDVLARQPAQALGTRLPHIIPNVTAKTEAATHAAKPSPSKTPVESPAPHAELPKTPPVPENPHGFHVLFVHKNFPAQFGHIAAHLIENKGFRCSFVSELPAGIVGGIQRIQYKLRGGATSKNHYCTRSFETATWHAHAVYEAMKAHSKVQPDLVVGHSGFGSTLYLADLYECPIINYFEFFYHSDGADMDFRPDRPRDELNDLRARTRNGIILLDLDTCTAGYSPTKWQHSLFPEVYKPKIEVIFDGIDRSFWYRREGVPRRFANEEIPARTKIVTYVSRGFESMRGFDIFMKVAKRICDLRDDVIFIAVGSDRDCYSGDTGRIKAKSYREHILTQDKYDLNRIRFPGRIPPQELVELLSISDLHIYLTAPFVLSWSCMNALSCGAVVLGSDTQPVTEMIKHEQNGLLAGFFDVDTLVAQAMRVLDDPAAFRPLGEAGMKMIEEEYSLVKMLPRMMSLYERVCTGRGWEKTMNGAPAAMSAAPSD